MGTVFISGIPVPQGSVRAFAVGGRALVTHADNAKLRSWRNDVGSAWGSANPGPPSVGPIRVVMTFVMPRPKTHTGAKGIKASAPLWHDLRPDIDKLARAVLDALTGVAYRDDSQVASLTARKRYSTDGSVGLWLRVQELSK